MVSSIIVGRAVKILVHFQWAAFDLFAVESLDDAVDILGGEDLGNTVILHGAGALAGYLDDVTVTKFIMGEK